MSQLTFYTIDEEKPDEGEEVLWIELDPEYGTITAQVGSVEGGYINGILMHESGMWAYTAELAQEIAGDEYR